MIYPCKKKIVPGICVMACEDKKVFILITHKDGALVAGIIKTAKLTISLTMTAKRRRRLAKSL